VRAVATVERALALHGAPVYVRKEIVHNRHVVENLRAKGAIFVDDLDAVPEGAITVFSAHGVSPAVRQDAQRRRLRTIDATCPLVTKVHQEVK
jgi:4-hydroxy-3-methylbut-2-enyl diphosphate reductase